MTEKKRTVICSPRDCVALLSRYGRMKQEHFGVIFLNKKKEVIQTKCFFVGSDDGCNISGKLIWWKACKLEASAIILFHNHPNGNTKPSDDDIKLTENFKKGGDLLGIQVLDHIIIYRYGYYSFFEEDIIRKEENQVNTAEL